jgi:hypothetical protein
MTILVRPRLERILDGLRCGIELPGKADFFLLTIPAALDLPSKNKHSKAPDDLEISGLADEALVSDNACGDYEKNCDCIHTQPHYLLCALYALDEP